MISTSKEETKDIELQEPKYELVTEKKDPSKEKEEKEDSQDTNQKIGVTIAVAVEIYRALIASFLILFVPQKCGDHVCSFSENAETGPDPLYNAGFVFNFLTMATFLALYYAEVRREVKLIAYLDVNPSRPSDNESVGQVLEKIQPQHKESILYYDSLYVKAGYLTIGCFTINSILSGLVVYKYYLDDKTTTTFITSLLFVIQKLQQVYVTLKTEKNIFYSAYLSSKVQYNDLDKDKIVKQIQVAAGVKEETKVEVEETKVGETKVEVEETKVGETKVEVEETKV